MENLNKRPSKGILRFSEGSSRSNSVEKDIKWDEANIKETLHPDDKDYGFMRIDEPPTPYSRSPHGHDGENSDDDDPSGAKTNELLERVSRKIKEPPVTIENFEGLLDENDLEAIESQDANDEASNGANQVGEALDSSSSSSLYTYYNQPQGSSTDAQTSRASGSSSASDFELKRKRHYNEFHAVKLAKKLMQKELAEDDDGDDDDNNKDDDDDHDNDNDGDTGDKNISSV